MIENQDILCISSIDWDFIWQGHQEIMSSLAANGNRVLFIENTGVRTPGFRDIPRLVKRIRNWSRSVKGMRKEKEGLFIYSPVILPFPYSTIARWINRRLIIAGVKRWMKSVGGSKPVIWTFLPTGLALDIINAIDNKLVVYYCIDNFAASSPEARKILKTEWALLKGADIVFVTARNLYDFCSKYNNNVHVFPYGVNMDVYEKAGKTAPKRPADIPATTDAIVGYVGGIHKWLDFELVKFLAREHPDKSFVFVGPLQEDVTALKGVKNLHFLGQKSYEELPSYIGQFKVCIIPYLLTEYTKNVYPTKINEYLCMGKPVVSTALQEVLAFNDRNKDRKSGEDIVFIGRTKEEFSGLVDKAGRESAISCEVADKRRAVAVKEGSWKVKIEDMCGLIESEIVKKEKERSVNWKDNILGLYRASKRKFLPAAAVIFALYLLAFHTPLIWMLGGPLKVSTPLKKADAIAVFGAGVGESGKAGQGYEERVKYAAELYRQGYGRFVIFSSGYHYAMKEAQVMKALAEYLGVPPDKILLDEDAANTYENVKNSMAISRQNGARSLVVISSPYNMLRVSLVFKKLGKDTAVVYAPIPYSAFYGDEKSVKVRHISGILHEYLGIIYYKLKGYI